MSSVYVWIVQVPNVLNREFGVVCVRPGTYVIGDENVADARPTHFRRIETPYWIDLAPVTALDFSEFVYQGGYDRSDWWSDGQLPDVQSVDERSELVRRASREAVVSDRPVRGLSWYEADAIARSYRGRLPFESEWEISARHSPKQIALAEDMLEWTADIFTPTYWRVDFSSRGVAWSANRSQSPVSVRGRSSDALVRNVCGRRGLAPSDLGMLCGFRRAWDKLPDNCVVIE